MRQILLFILFPFILFGQTQIGIDIDGDNLNSHIGSHVSLSSDGSIVAISGVTKDINTSVYHFKVRVYKNISGDWAQIGNDIDGESTDGGPRVELSSGGLFLAVGNYYKRDNGTGSFTSDVRVFKNISNVWTQIGDKINVDGDGCEISISSDGSVLAVGSPLSPGAGSTFSGQVKIYKNISNIWTQIGEDINGEAVNDFSGSSVSLSSDGSIVAIGAPSRDGVNGLNSGYLRIFKNESEIWTQMGNSIEGLTSMGRFGGSASLSSNGSVVAIGATFGKYVLIFKNISNVWTQIGDKIEGEVVRLSLSADGSILAIGSPNYSPTFGLREGRVRVFKNISNEWNAVGNDIVSEAAYDAFGSSLSLSSNGSIIAIGAPNNDGANGVDSGHVRIYNLASVLSTEKLTQDQFLLFPNPVKNNLNIELNKGLEFNKANIYNAVGQFIKSTKKLTINTNYLTSGIYYIEVETNQGKLIKKIVVE